MSALAELAAARGLATVAAELGRFAQAGVFERAVSEDPRLVAPANPELTDLLGQFVRRGADPPLVKALLLKLDGRPLERALVAWDVLAGALWPRDATLVDELKRLALPLAAVWPQPGERGVDLNRHPAELLVARYGGASLRAASLPELLTGAADYSLASLAELLRRRDDFARKPALHASLHAFGRVVHLAHFPTWAAVLLDFVSRPLGYRPAALDVCETMFDADAARRIPGDAIRPGDHPQDAVQDIAEYLTCRAHLAAGDPGQAHAIAEANFARRAGRPAAPRLDVVRAHLGVLHGRSPVPLARVEAAAAAAPTWRYGAAVRVQVAAAQLGASSRRPVELLHDFVTAFGHDDRCLRDALVAGAAQAAWKADAASLVGRELRALPHAIAPWRALALFVVGERFAKRAEDELTTRLREQCRL
jgi:hypothetical protein